jgi:hypothetical protein
MIKRLDTLDITATDVDQTGAVYQKNFGFKVERIAGTDDAEIAIGDARIRLRSGAGAEGALKSTSEGLAAIWLEAEDVELVAAALDRAGLKHQGVHRDRDRRILEVDPSASNLVPLYIFDRKAQSD